MPDSDARTKSGHERPVLTLARCADLAAASLATCHDRTATTLIYLGGIGLGRVDIASPPPPRPVSAATLDTLPLAGLVAATDGQPATLERVRTLIEASAPAAAPVTDADIGALKRHLIVRLQRLCNVGLLLALLVAGCSLAIAVSAGLIERKRPFALLRLTGAPVSSLNRVVLTEAAAPLLLVAAASAGLGLAVAAMILKVTGVVGWRPPDASYWGTLSAGIIVALLTVAATLPLLKRVTSLETARFE